MTTQLDIIIDTYYLFVHVYRINKHILSIIYITAKQYILTEL